MFGILIFIMTRLSLPGRVSGSRLLESSSVDAMACSVMHKWLCSDDSMQASP